MSQLSEAAVDLFNQGFNCAQAVFGSFCEKYGLRQEQAFQIATGLGGGIRCGEACGAVTGAVLVIGLKYGNADQKEGNTKALCYEKTTEFINLFKQKQGSIVCKDLLGCDIGEKEGMQKAINTGLFKEVCPVMVKEAVQLLEALGY